MRFYDPLIRKDPRYRHGIWFSSTSPSRLIFIERGQIVSVKAAKDIEFFETFLKKVNALSQAQLDYALSKSSHKDSLGQTLKNLGFLPKVKLQALQQEWVLQLLSNWILDESTDWKFEPVNHASEDWGLNIDLEHLVLSCMIHQRSLIKASDSRLIKLRVTQHQFNHLLVGPLEPFKSIFSSNEWILSSELIGVVSQSELVWGLLDYLKMAGHIQISDEVILSKQEIPTPSSRRRLNTRVLASILLGIVMFTGGVWGWQRYQSKLNTMPLLVPMNVNSPIQEQDHWTIVISIQADETLLTQIKSDFAERYSLYYSPSPSQPSAYQVSLGDFRSYSEALEVLNSLDLMRRPYTNGWGVRKFKDLQ
ncbi:MAG: hypothetical protein ACKN9J_05210 [Holophagaceae bacterium]